MVSYGPGTGLGAGQQRGGSDWLVDLPLDSNEPIKVLTSQIMAAPGPGRHEARLRSAPAILRIVDCRSRSCPLHRESPGSGQTLAEHWQDMLRLYARRIKADPQDAYAYSDRAGYYDYLHEQTNVHGRSAPRSAVMSGRSPSDLRIGTARGFRRVIDLPSTVNSSFLQKTRQRSPVLSIAFGRREGVR